MKAEYLEKAVTSAENNQILKPVLKASYSLIPLSKLEVMQIAQKVNDQLGYPLFEDIYYPRLILDFARVTHAAQYNAVHPINETKGDDN